MCAIATRAAVRGAIVAAAPAKTSIGVFACMPRKTHFWKPGGREWVWAQCYTVTRKPGDIYILDSSLKTRMLCYRCPCLGCAIKIVQTGVTEVVYNLSYKLFVLSCPLVFIECDLLNVFSQFFFFF